MSVKDEQIRWILSQFPDASDDNTRFCLRFWKTAAESIGVIFPPEIEEIILKYKPESIVRKRREFVEPTKGQREKEQEMRKYYK